MRQTLVLVATLVASSSPAFAMHPGARPGEAFTFKFSIGPVEGGRARMSIGKTMSRGNRRLVAVHGQAETTSIIKLVARMDDDYRLVVDTGNLLPVSVSETERGVRERRIKSTMSGRTADVDFWAPNKQSKGRHTLTRLARDPLSAFFALRALPLESGHKMSLDILDGNALWRVALDVKRGESLRVGDGGAARRAIRVDGVARRIEDSGQPRAGQGARGITIWLSDDADRVLLRLEADTDMGRCALELTSYDAPPQVAVETTPQLPGIDVR
ncbi:MAG: hypothetical protein JWN44_1413 [Myxococcales bacterium]|nr:hypothetical protein [Myxococcales bacterium]